MNTYGDLSKKARAISESDECCDHCYYGTEDIFGCACPFSDGLMEDLQMDPCYDGALIHLAQEMVWEELLGDES